MVEKYLYFYKRYTWGIYHNLSQSSPFPTLNFPNCAWAVGMDVVAPPPPRPPPPPVLINNNFTSSSAMSHNDYHTKQTILVIENEADANSGNFIDF